MGGRTYLPQSFHANVQFNTLFPPQSFNITGIIPPVESFHEAIEVTAGVFEDLLHEVSIGVIGKMIYDSTGRLLNFDNEATETSIGVIDNMVAETSIGTFENMNILLSAT